MTTPSEDDSQTRPRLLFLGLWTGGVLALAAISLAPPFLPIYRYLGYGLFLDNILHFLFFAGMAAMAPFAFGRYAFTGALIVLLLLAFVLEGLQFFIPSHKADPVDFFAGVAGLAVGGAIGLLIKRISAGMARRTGV